MRDEKRMTFVGHIVEFRNRLRISVLIFVLAFFISYAFSDKILTFVWDHFLGIYASDEFNLAILAESVMSGFVTQLNLAFVVAASASFPVFIYEMFLFMEPALEDKHRWIAIKIILSAISLFILGVFFVYYIMLPMLISFFISSNTNLGIANYFAVESFFEFIIMNLFIGGIMFQTPLIVVMANRVGLLPKPWLLKSRRIIYISVLVLAGIITPDHSIISQLVLGGVMIVLFEISLLFSK
jgi:sec-independent protein translocase protein TatC